MFSRQTIDTCGRFGVVLIGVWMMTGCDGPQRLMMRDGLTQTPLNNVLLLMELQTEYETPDPMMGGMYREENWRRYRRRYHIHGYGGPVKGQSWVPGMYYNTAYLSQLPEEYYPDPDKIDLEVISSGWKIFTSERTVVDTDPSYAATLYYLFKQDFIPRMIDREEMRLLATKKGVVTITLKPLRPGTKESDLAVVHTVGSVLAILRKEGATANMRQRLLDQLGYPLRRIVEFGKADAAPYDGYAETRQEAERLLKHIEAL